MPKWTHVIALTVALVALAGSALALAESVQSGNLRVSMNGRLSPHTLPRKGTAPVSVTIGGKISTTDESEPPQLRKMRIEINRHGRIEFAGLPTCRTTQINTASNQRALAACGGALVGEGGFLGTISLPGSAPYPLEGKLLVFNGIEDGRHVLLGHIFSPHPFATSFVISFAIGGKAHGTYGTVLTADLRKALGSKKNLTGIEMTLSRRYTYKGRRRSYVSAGCPAPKGLPSVSYSLARIGFTFADGRKLGEVLSRTCKAKG
ncbi:MAG: hypothetical protein ACTHNP_07075 [Solirubrobacterales bacterium]